MPRMADDTPTISVDAAVVAARLGMRPDVMMAEMRKGHVFQVTEKGVGEDAGRYRLTFRYRSREAVIVVDEHGFPLDGK